MSVSFFFFKQKTAYEMRISDWSSDVCSSDLGYDLTAFMIRESSDVSVTNSEFSHLWHGMSILNNTGLTISDNYIHDIRTDGVRGGGNSDTDISKLGRE